MIKMKKEKNLADKIIFWWVWIIILAICVSTVIGLHGFYIIVVLLLYFILLNLYLLRIENKKERENETRK